MAAPPPPQNGPVGPDTLITCKVLIEGTNRRFKLALRDLSANTLPQKLRFLLAIPPERDVKFDRFSDSAGAYVSLDSTNPAVYKQLYRAAKAKLKLRLRATVLRPAQITEEETVTPEQEGSSAGVPRQSSYLETVLSYPPAPTAESVAESQESTPVRTFRSTERVVPKVVPAPEPIQLSRPTLPSLHDFSCNIFSIDCNSCNNTIPNEHYHCSICEHGDFDLCQACVDSGATCHGDEHWLIKRMIKNGRIVPSITEIVPPKAVSKTLSVEEAQPAPSVYDEEERTCNSCINQFPASSFVTCKDCPDFDLCFSCFNQGEHGHHPAHVFHPTREQPSSLSAKIKVLCGAGRGVRHEAVCDGCDKQIVGIRHKCLSCPDFDYCSSCVGDAASLHPAHRFVPVYEHLPILQGNFRKEVHRGIYCDGIECTSRARKTWIKGDRYKCAICHDTDFCANCEASPKFDHNKTHPLIKMRIPVHSINIATFDEHAGQTVQLGDRPLARHASTETTRSTSINAATQVQTVAEVKPVETKPVEVQEPVVPKVEIPVTKDLQAWFIVDSTPDGSTFAPDHLVSQSWTLRNPGPHSWPAGCAVYFTGGDDMRNLDMKNPSSVSDMTIANRSNVLEHPLQPGQTAVFTVMLKSPPRECRAISYWRLKTPSGDAFGHKLWVDITVAKKSNEKEAISAAPVPEPFQAEADDQAQQSSTMIFPRLEKESPDSSIHNVASGMSVTTAAETVAANHQKELVDDLESLTFDDYEATEDGFMTDEEYDILDADDEDGLSSANRIGA